MADFNPHVGDIGVELTVDFKTKDCADAIVAVDLSPAGTVITICLRTPGGTVKTFTGVASTCDTFANGTAAYITLSGTDLDVAGVWQISGKAVFLDGRVFRASSKNFTVDTPLCP